MFPDQDFMVVDAGGGTIDITVHGTRVGGLVEIDTPSGGMWGSSYINKKFEALLEEMFTKQHIDEMKNSDQWCYVMENFEV